MFNSAAEIIDQKGGPSVFAEKVGYRVGAVRVWKHRDYFPRKAWPDINGAFPDLALDVLRAIEYRRGKIDRSPKRSAA